MRTYKVTVTTTMTLICEDDAILRAVRDADGSWATEHGLTLNVDGAPEERNVLYREQWAVHMLALRVGIDEVWPRDIPGFEDLADDAVRATDIHSTSTFERLDTQE